MNSVPAQPLPTATPEASASRPFDKKWRRLLLIFLLPVLICGTCWGVPFFYHQLTFHPKGKIAFECSPGRADSEICIVNADGSQYKILYPKGASRPSWSPDGTQLAFSSVEGLVVMDLESAALRKISDGGGRQVWSPDGKQIAFIKRSSSDSEDITGLYVINNDGTGEIRLTNSIILNLAWSLDSKHIAYTTDPDEFDFQGRQVYTINANGTDNTLLINNAFAEQPSWSPDGQQIVFTVYVSQVTAETRISIIDVNSREETQLTSEFSYSPIWSPDGKTILYYCLTDLCSMNADGRNQKRMIKAWSDPLNFNQASPGWSPDGQYIVYYASPLSCWLCNMSGQLWIMKADGSQRTKITDGPVDQFPVWQPLP